MSPVKYLHQCAALILVAADLRAALDTVATLMNAGPMQTEGKAGTPPRRVPFVQEGEWVLRANSLFVKRAQSRQAVYAARKEGRVLSSANRTKLEEMRPQIETLLSIIDDLLAASAPPEKADDWGAEWMHTATRQARASALRLRS